jgi:hypothetical protein
MERTPQQLCNVWGESYKFDSISAVTDYIFPVTCSALLSHLMLAAAAVGMNAMSPAGPTFELLAACAAAFCCHYRRDSGNLLFVILLLSHQPSHLLCCAACCMSCRDPGNWATGLAGGAQCGYGLLSVILLLVRCAAC